MRKTYLYSTLILSLFSLSIAASSRLTVVAVVDGLDSDNLAMLRPYWQKGGLRTLSEEAYQTSVAFPHEVYGGNETTATLMTGTTPDRHGYTMDRYFLRRDRLLHGMLEDESAKGIGTSLCLSAKALLSRTLSDRMRLLSPAAKIYAVGIQPETTVLMAGHAANACCWLDSEAQQWVASSAYSEGLPSAAYEQNSNMRIPTLAARQWTPRMDIPTYSCPTPQEQKKGFSYEVAPVLAYTPTANTLVIELALALQQSERLGVDAQPDLLLLQLNSLSPKATSDRIASAEHEDMYLWLNQDLGYLMEQLDRRIGRENYQLLVVGRPMLGTDAQTLADLHMPVQYFNVDRAAALTGTYLICLTGEGAAAESFAGIGKGELWSLACAVLFAIQMMVVDHFARSSDLLVMSVSQLFTCALVGAPLMFLLPSETARLSLGAVRDAAMPLVYCGVFSSGIAYTLQNVAQSRTSASVAAIVLSTESVFGALSGWIVLHDVLSAGQFCGCALVFVAVVATQLLAARKTASAG